MTTPTTAPSGWRPGFSAPAVMPRRVLSVSADMGGGHNATAAALEEAARTLWPGSEVRRIDTLDVLGPGVGRLFRAIYVANVESTPWLYEFFYASLWRRRWFAHASKRVTGSWCGRRLAGQIDRFDPDLIVSTYPIGSAGLAWLRRHRGLGVPVAAYISDFAPHPFWVYPDIDTNFVVHESAVPSAHTAEPRAVVDVCAPPVISAFAPGERAEARRSLGLRENGFVVLVSCGAYAFGHVGVLVRALLDASPTVQVVAACGHGEDTRARLAALQLPTDRLEVLGWTDRMAEYMQAADLVVSNAGGATALEAVACARPVVLSEPIAAHGVANADLMVVAGLAEMCSTQDQLTSYVRAAVTDRSELGRLERRAAAHAAKRDLASGLAWLAGPHRTPADRRPWPMRGADGFFAHVESPNAVQETGVVLELGDVVPGQQLSLADLHALLAIRALGLPSLRRQLVRRPRLGWILRDDVDVAAHATEHLVGSERPDETVDDAVGDVWSVPLPEDRPAWSMTLIRDESAGRTVLAIKMHHCQGDGISLLGVLDRILSADPDDPLRERGRERSGQAPRTGDPRAAIRATGRQARRLATGLWSLAVRGSAPAAPLNVPVTGTARRFVCVPLSSAALKAAARAQNVRPHELVLTVAAAAIGSLLEPAGLAPQHGELRSMLPIAMRPPVLDRVFGNWTGSIAVTLPIAPMPFPERLAAISSDLRARAAVGEPDAGSAVVRLAGLLPQRVHRRLARLAYDRRFFNTIVTYLPGARGDRWCGGARVLAAYPVVPLAARVPFTTGVLVSGETAGVGVMMDPALPLTRRQVEDAFRTAFAEAGEGGPY